MNEQLEALPNREKVLLPQDPMHVGVLAKFTKLKGKILEGAEPIKGSGDDGLPADELVPVAHRLHHLIRGFYKPEGSDYVLSFLATEKDENYGEQIKWRDREAGELEEVRALPPSAEGDHAAKSDVKAARKAMQDGVPIGLLENIEKGRNRVLGIGRIVEEDEDGAFVIEPLELKPEQIQASMGQASRARTDPNYFMIRTKHEEVVKAYQDGQEIIELGGFYVNKSSTRKGDVVFFCFGGDSPPWEPGLHALCLIEEGPYDVGYEKTSGGTEYFKIRIRVLVRLPQPIDRPDLVNYPECYNIPFIAPMTKWEANQANQKISQDQAVSLVRAILDFFPALEDAMTGVFGAGFIAKSKEDMQVLVPRKAPFGAQPKPLKPEKKAQLKKQWDPDIDRIKGPLKMQDGPIDAMRDMVNIGKHLVMMGPPGTGKTTLAHRAAREAVRTSFAGDHVFATANSDWTTYDLIGGLMPQRDGGLAFREGVALEAIRRNAWLVIDEINRCEIDKAFGAIFTVLAGQPATLGFEDEAGHRISVEPSSGLESGYDEATATYLVGNNWRILATMNTYDKNALYTLSYALMRRFSFIEIPVPDRSDVERLLASIGLSAGNRAFVLSLLDGSPRDLGPAIVEEVAEYLSITGSGGRVSAITGLVLPQYEGLSRSEVRKLYTNLAPQLSAAEAESLRATMSDFFRISSSEFPEVSREGEDAGDGPEPGSDSAPTSDD